MSFVVTQKMKDEAKQALHHRKYPLPTHVLFYQYEGQDWEYVFCKNYTQAQDVRDKSDLNAENSSIISVYTL